jgi:hypothetical protein
MSKMIGVSLKLIPYPLLLAREGEKATLPSLLKLIMPHNLLLDTGVVI